MDNMELVQVHVGSATPFWDLPFSEFGKLAPRGWLKHTWEALDESPLSLRGPLATEPSLRQHDVHLMDVFARDPVLKQKERAKDLLSLQNCRLFLGVTRLSEIATAKGTQIRRECWEGKAGPHRQRISESWPKAYRPSPNDWTLWRGTLR